MQTLKPPVIVDILIETPTITTEAFFSIGFIVESDIAPRTFEITKLSQILDLGFARVSMAYNVAYSVLSQKKMERVIFRSKRSEESYIEAYEADDNSSFYYISIEDKNIDNVLEFNDHISPDTNKLQFFSTTEDVSSLIGDRRLVYFYQDRFTGLDIPPYYSEGIKDYWQWDDLDITDWDSGDKLLLERQDMSVEDAQTRKSIYPETAWIGYCGWFFPSRVQWLHKHLNNVDSKKYKQIPDLATSHGITLFSSTATQGSGTTCQGVPINIQVSLDWLVYAISKRLWNILYRTETKINATRGGLDILEAGLLEVLNLCITENIFSDFRIISRSVDRRTGKASFKFSATLVHSILGVDKVEGKIYH